MGGKEIVPLLELLQSCGQVCALCHRNRPGIHHVPAAHLRTSHGPLLPSECPHLSTGTPTSQDYSEHYSEIILSGIPAYDKVFHIINHPRNTKKKYSSITGWAKVKSLPFRGSTVGTPTSEMCPGASAKAIYTHPTSGQSHPFPREIRARMHPTASSRMSATALF